MLARLRMLLWREWRDLRSVALGCAALAVLISVLTQHYVFDYREAGWAVSKLVPILTAVFVAIAASDLVSADAKTRRLETLASLPIRSGAVWTGKVAFLLLAGLGFAAFTFLLQAAIPFIAGNGATAADTFKFVLHSVPGLYGALVVGCAVLLFSTLAFRSFVSALLGVGVVVGAAWFLLDVQWHAVGRGTVWLTVKGATPVVVLLGASRLAFVRGGVQRGARLRPALLSFGLILAVAVPATVYASAKITDYNVIRPGADGIGINRLQVSPNGRYLAIHVDRWSKPGSGRTWIVSIEDGALLHWSVERQSPASGWTRDNLLYFYGARSVRGGWVDNRAQFLDPVNGAVAREAPRMEAWKQLARQGRDNPEWGSVGGTFNSNKSCRFWVNLRGTGEQIPVMSFGRPLLLQPEGQILLWETPERLLWMDVKSGETRLVVDDLARSGVWLSPSRKYVSANRSQETRVIEIATGETVWGPQRKGQHGWVWSPTGIDLFTACRQKDEYWELIDAETWKPIPVERVGNTAWAPVWGLQAVAPGRFAAIRYDEVVLLDREGKVLRTLFKNEPVEGSSE